MGNEKLRSCIVTRALFVLVTLAMLAAGFFVFPAHACGSIAAGQLNTEKVTPQAAEKTGRIESNTNEAFETALRLIGINNPVKKAVFRIAMFILLTFAAYRTAKDPVEGLMWLAGSTCFDVVGRIARFSGNNFITAYQVLMMVFCFCHGIRFLKEKKYFYLSEIPFIKWGVLFVIIMGGSLLYTSNLRVAIVDFVRICMLCMVLSITAGIKISEKDMEKLTNFFILTGVFNVLLVAYQYSTGNLVVTCARIGISPVIPFIIRAAGFFYDPNKFAVFLAACMLILASHMLIEKKKVIYVVLLIMQAGVLFMTFSRSAWIAVLSGMLIILLNGKNPARKIILFFSGLAIITGMMAVMPGTGKFLRKRIESLTVSSHASPGNIIRVNMAKSAIKMFLEQPFGVGWRGFPVTYPKYIIPGTPKAGKTGAEHMITESHSLPFTVIAELGIQGMVVLVIILFYLSKFIFNGLREIDYGRAMFCGIAGVITAFMVDFCFYSDMFDNIFWIFLGLLIAVGNGVKNES